MKIMNKTIQNYWMIIIAIILVAVLLGIGKLSGVNSKISFLNPASKVAQQAIDYINNNLLEGRTAVLESARLVSGVYEFKLKIDNQEYTSYITRDGKILFTSGIPIEPPKTSSQNNQPPKAAKTCEDLTKVDEPLLEAFVVSKCPFGLQMQRILAEIIKNIPSAAKYIKVEYMGSISNGKVVSMHDASPGGEEATENLRQVCLREEQPDTYWDYLSCHIKKGDVNSCLAQAKVDISKLNSCLSDANKGLAYIQKDFNRQDQFKVTGSPTLILNSEVASEFDFGGRTAEAVKTLLCCSFKNKPNFCATNLSTASAATGFSENYSSGTSNNSNASCN